MTEEQLIGAETDRGFNMILASGRPYFPAHPRADELFIEDVAHHLAQINRYAGACRAPYSVAQHSVLVSKYAEEEARLEPCFERVSMSLQGLLHDGPEFAINDIIRPIKVSDEMRGYATLEKRGWVAFSERFHLPLELNPIIKKIDNRMAATERRDLLPESPDVDWGELPEPYPEKIIPWAWDAAKDAFLDRFYEIKKWRAA